ncbi:peptide chain release factor N(5)-glutamine methyltransferase [Plantactinospora sp. B5E13]|uniref:peptide chain release factor N(5)-glutamine methyltransferase n=1 Tax=unclassified Plantactinospora TaxID=2631981 RepID=UPI00325D877F
MTHIPRHPQEATDWTPPSVAISDAASALAGAGVEPARVEAELLVGYVLGVSRAALVLADPLSPDQSRRLRELVARRVRREPLQYLLGTAAFRYLELAVGPGVFVPRPETELLAGWGVEQAAALLPSDGPGGRGGPSRSGRSGLIPSRVGPPRPGTPASGAAGPVVVDLCSGSGAVALAVAQEVPGARVIAVERSPAALTWLNRNADDRARAGDPPIGVVEGDVADPELLPELTGRVDVLLCNPPYVPDGTVVGPEVAGHDPAEAVFGGPDGLAVIRQVVAAAARLLRPGGTLGIEHDDTHGAAVPALLSADGRFIDVVDHVDLVGRPRYVTARRDGAGPGPDRTRDTVGGAAWQTGSP